MDIGSSGSQYLIKVTFAAILNEVWPQFNNANIWVVRRKEGGQYGFTAAIAADEQKLVVGNPMQRSYVYKRGAHACGSVGEVNPNNVFKAPGLFCLLNCLNRIWQRRLLFSFFVISWYSSCKASITTIRTMIKFSERRRRQSGKVSAIAFVFLVVTLWYFAEVPHCWRFTPNAAYLNENHASNENNLGKHASFALATGEWRNNKHEMFH